MRVLIAEDDPALASFVRKGLEAEHYAVDVTTCGEQARAMAAEMDYDLLLLDLNLAGVDGMSILRHLRTRKPSMPILILTSRNRVEDRVQCLDLGADDFVGKPFSFAELSARIRALLRRSHLPAASVLAVDDLKLDRMERKVERGGRRYRVDLERIWIARVSDAECRASRDQADDHRACMESVIRHRNQCDRRVRELSAAESGCRISPASDSHHPRRGIRVEFTAWIPGGNSQFARASRRWLPSFKNMIS